MSGYYDILRAILEAIAISKGYKIYTHEAFTSFLRLNNEEAIAEKFDTFRRIRNGINYYGEDISVKETEENVAEIRFLIKTLKNKFLKNSYKRV